MSSTSQALEPLGPDALAKIICVIYGGGGGGSDDGGT